jgi:hypothetical protein
MGRKFLTTLTLPSLPSAPSSPSIGDMYFDTTLGKIGVYTSSGWVYKLYQIEDGSITTSKIANGAVTSSKLAPGATIANIGYTPVNKAGDTMSGTLTLPAILGPNNADFLVSGQNYGVEIRIDEDSTNDNTFKITKGSGSSLTSLLTLNSGSGNLGVGVSSPSEKLEVGGNIKASVLISAAPSGTSPLQISSNTLVSNLNSDLLDGYHASATATANTIAARDNSGNISASAFVSTVSTGTAPFQVSSTTRVVNLNADLLDGYDGVDFARKAENATINGTWTFSSTVTFSATPTFSAGLTISGGVGTWTTSEWAKAIDLLKGQALVWRSGGGLAIGLGVNNSSSTIYLSSSTADDNSTDASYPIVFDVANGRIGVGTTTPLEKLEIIGGNVRAVQLQSTASTGTAPLVVNSTTLVTNLNADLLDGYNSSTSATENTVAIRDSSGNLSAFSFVSTATSGTAPFQVSSATKVTNLNADLLDGYDTSTSATANTIAVRDSNGYLNAFGLIGSNTKDLLINGKNYGIELRIDEGNAGTRTFKITKTSSGTTTLVSVDSSGNTNISGTLSVTGVITGFLNGNASTASKLQTARNISLGGSISGSASFDGSADITINASINSGAVGTTQLADGAVTTSKIADGSVTSAKLAPDVVLGSGGARIFQTTIGDGTNSTYTVTHNLNTTNIEVSLILLSTNEKIGAKVEVLNVNQIQVSFIAPIGTNSVKVVVVG